LNCTEAGLGLKECEFNCTDPSLSEFFCGLCENGVECVEFPEIRTEQECRERVACVSSSSPDLPGEYPTTISTTEGSCESISYCTTPCYETIESSDGDHQIRLVECQSRSQCERSGICGRSWAYFGASGACVYPQPPYFQFPACGWDVGVRFGSYASELGCINYQLNGTDCKEEGGVWLKTATTEKQCREYGTGCLEETTLDTYLNPEILSHKPRGACDRCGGEPTPLIKWRRGQWREATSRPLEWRRRQYIQKFRYDDTLSFATIYADLEFAINNKFALGLQAEVECRYNRIMQLLETLACDCTSDSNGQEDCYSSFRVDVPSGAAIVCPGVETLIEVI